MDFEEWYEAYYRTQLEHPDKETARVAWNSALVVASNKCFESDGWDMHPKDYGKLVLSCQATSPPTK